MLHVICWRRNLQTAPLNLKAYLLKVLRTACRKQPTGWGPQENDVHLTSVRLVRVCRIGGLVTRLALHACRVTAPSMLKNAAKKPANHLETGEEAAWPGCSRLQLLARNQSISLSTRLGHAKAEPQPQLQACVLLAEAGRISLLAKICFSTVMVWTIIIWALRPSASC